MAINTLANMTDQQNHLLTQLSYYNDTMDEGQTIKEWFDSLDKSTIKTLKEKGLYNDLKKDKSIMSLEITHIADDKDTGFGAIAFTDSNGNTGFSYRGTDFFEEYGIDFIDDIASAANGDSTQTKQALKFYNKYKNKNGNNYLYGHSKGGDLATYVYLEDYDDIKGCHTLNAQPRNCLGYSADQISALQSSKYDPVVNEYDFVSGLGSCFYANKIRFIRNSNPAIGLIIGHSYKSGLYNKDGSIVECRPSVVNVIVLGVFSNVLGVFQMSYKGWMLYADLTGEFLINLENGMYDTAVHIINEIDKLGKEVISFVKGSWDAVINGYKTIVKNAQKWYNENFNEGYKYAYSHPYISVNTDKLDSYATRLLNVNRRLTNLDRRIHQLYGKVKLRDIYDLIQSDLIINYSITLKLCSNYLSNTSKDFKNVEKDILKKG